MKHTLQKKKKVQVEISEVLQNRNIFSDESLSLICFVLLHATF